MPAETRLKLFLDVCHAIRHPPPHPEHCPSNDRRLENKTKRDKRSHQRAWEQDTAGAAARVIQSTAESEIGPTNS